MTQKLKVNDILDKEFHVDFKGYNALEVDQFLDLVIQDYETFESIIREQKQLLDRYEKTLADQKRMLLEYESQSRAEKVVEPQPSYVDLIRRVSKLEDAIFKK